MNPHLVTSTGYAKRQECLTECETKKAVAMESWMTPSQSAALIASPYRSYLVRFWQSNEQGSWHASAQCVQTGNTVLFGDVDSLLRFLNTEISGTPSDGELKLIS